MITGLRTRFSGRELRRHLQTQIRELTAVVEIPVEAKTPVAKAEGRSSPQFANSPGAQYAETKITGRPPIGALAQAMGGEENFKQAANGSLVAESIGIDPAKVRAAHQLHEQCQQDLETAKYWLDNIDADEEYLLSAAELAELGYEVPGSEEEEVPPAYSAYEPPDRDAGPIFPVRVLPIPFDDIRTRLIKLQYVEDLSSKFTVAITAELERLGVETFYSHEDPRHEEEVVDEVSGD